MDQITPFGGTITLIHFVHQASPERVVCMPSMTEFHSTYYHPSHGRSNDPRAVTCLGCKKTPEYKRSMEAHGVKA